MAHGSVEPPLGLGSEQAEHVAIGKQQHLTGCLHGTRAIMLCIHYGSVHVAAAAAVGGARPSAKGR